MFGLAPMDGFHLEGVAKDEGEARVGPEVGEPVPGAEAFHGPDPTVPIGGHGLEEGLRSGFQVAVQHDVAIMTQDANVHASGMRSIPQ
jgi:hypothetical protein